MLILILRRVLFRLTIDVGVEPTTKAAVTDSFLIARCCPGTAARAAGGPRNPLARLVRRSRPKPVGIRAHALNALLRLTQAAAATIFMAL